MPHSDIKIFSVYRSGTHLLAHLVHHNILPGVPYNSLFHHPHGYKPVESPDTLNLYIHREFDAVARSMFKFRSRMGLAASSFEEFLSLRLSSMYRPNLTCDAIVTTPDGARRVTRTTNNFANNHKTFREYWALHVEYWTSLDIPNLMIVSYEKLVADQEAITRAIADRMESPLESFQPITERVGWVVNDPA